MRERTYISLDEQMAWSQSKEAGKTAFADTVGNVNTIEHNSLQEAYKEFDREYAKETKQADITTKKNETQEIQEQRAKLDRQAQENRNKIMQKEKKLGVEGLLSREDIERIANSVEKVGAKDPLKEINKEDVKGLEGKMTRKKTNERASPLERKGNHRQSLQSRLTEIKKDLHKEQDVQKEVKNIEKTSDKDLLKSGKKVSKEQLALLSGRTSKKDHTPAVERTGQAQERINNAAQRVQNAELTRQMKERSERTH
ncbi:MAG: hypothetical protein J5716_08520 [Alphaproteobacteria bacterium]|nr:hypothetical protein [Alphaproteobacteria bacterium]